MRKEKIYIIPSIIATLILILCLCLRPIKTKAESTTNNLYLYQTNMYIENYTSFGSVTLSNTYVWYYFNNINASSIHYIGYAPTTSSMWLNRDTKLLSNIYFVENKTLAQLTTLSQQDEDLFVETLGTPIFNVYANNDGFSLGAANIETKNYNGCFVIELTDAWDDTINDNYVETPIVTVNGSKLEEVINGPTKEEQEYEKRYWYDFGYSNGYDDGMDAGYDMGYDDALQGNAAYESGKQAGIKSNSVRIGQVIASIFSGLTSFLNIELFGGITLGGIMLLPIMFGALWVVLKIIRG